jgi:hypothetical protein
MVVERGDEEVVPYEAEIDGWSIIFDGADLFIQGPNGLQIEVRRFDQAKIQHNQPVRLGTIGDSQQLDWLYPLEEGIALHLVSSSGPDCEILHNLHLEADGGTGNWRVGWHVPNGFAAMLYQLEALSGKG